MKVDFNNGKIYMLICNRTNKIYIGSTTESIKIRLQKHYKYYNEYLEGKRKYTCSSSKILEKGKTYIMLLENYPCKSKAELYAREEMWLSKFRPICVNKNRAKCNHIIGYSIYQKSTSIKFINSIEFID